MKIVVCWFLKKELTGSQTYIRVNASVKYIVSVYTKLCNNALYFTSSVINNNSNKRKALLFLPWIVYSYLFLIAVIWMYYQSNYFRDTANISYKLKHKNTYVTSSAKRYLINAQILLVLIRRRAWCAASDQGLRYFSLMSI